ncbi:MAG: Hsp20 family protein [Bacteroidota bacterium]|nr:Hsp20 family protein [Bacteroidota bacterium]
MKAKNKTIGISNVKLFPSVGCNDRLLHIYNAKDDSISANYEDGVLKLTIPKSKTQVKSTKEIKVN